MRIRVRLAAAVVSWLLLSGSAAAEGINDVSDVAVSAAAGADSFSISSGGSSETHRAHEWDVGARFVPARHFLLDLDFGATRISGSGTSVDFNRFNGGLGFLGYMGPRATWQVEAIFTSQRMAADCAGCGGSTKTGYGVRTEFLIPFADRWIVNVGGGYTRLSPSQGDDAIDEGSFGVGAEFRLNPVLGLFIAGQSDYYLDSANSKDYFSLVSLRLGVSANFGGNANRLRARPAQAFANVPVTRSQPVIAPYAPPASSAPPPAQDSSFRAREPVPAARASSGSTCYTIGITTLLAKPDVNGERRRTLSASTAVRLISQLQNDFGTWWFVDTHGGASGWLRAQDISANR